MRSSDRYASSVHVAAPWIFATTALNALLLLFGLSWLMNLQVAVPGIKVELPSSPYKVNASPDIRPVILRGDLPHGLYFEDTFMDKDEFDQRLSHARHPLQLLLLPDRTVMAQDVVDLSNLILAHGHQVVLGATEPHD